MSIEDISDMEFDELLQQLHLSKLNVVDLRINEWLEMSEKLLGVDSDPANDTLSTSGMRWEVSRTVFHSWKLSFMGMEIALIDCIHQWFTYPNFSVIRTFLLSEQILVTVGHRVSDKRGSTVIEFILYLEGGLENPKKELKLGEKVSVKLHFS